MGAAAPLGWALCITATEAAWRWRIGSRARAWQLTSLSLLLASLLASPNTRRGRRRPAWPSPPAPQGRRRAAKPPSRTARGGRRPSGWLLWLGLILSLAGYPLGRMVAADRADTPPCDTLRADLLALSVLALAEERTWAVHVEPRLGPVLTAVLFALKHPLLDHRWRRVPGLALFWIGLSLVRQRSRSAALWLHVAANASGVLLGHARQRDQF